MINTSAKSIANLLKACENSKYQWFLRERDFGKNHIICSHPTDLHIYLQWSNPWKEEEVNSALIDFGDHKVNISELEKKLGVEPCYFVKQTDTKYYMKPNVNSIILDGIVDYVKAIKEN